MLVPIALWWPDTRLWCLTILETEKLCSRWWPVISETTRNCVRGGVVVAGEAVLQVGVDSG